MSREIWKNVQGFEGYQVSNLGKVRSLDRVLVTERNGQEIRMRFSGKVLKKHINNDGYNCVHLSMMGQSHYFLVHRLVICTFKNKSFDWPYNVHFCDSDKTNDKLKNLLFDHKINEYRRPDNSKRRKRKVKKVYEVA